MSTARPSRPIDFHTIFRDAPEPSWVVETDTLRILGTNRRAEEVFGYTQAEFLERTLPDLVQPWDTDKFKEALSAREFGSPEFRGVTAFTASGASIAIDLLIASTSWAKSGALIVTVADAAPRIRLEEQLRQAQKMESLGMLAGGIAHDFNNLLTIISGYSHMLASGLAGDSDNRSAAEQVIKASDRAAALTRQLLSFSRRQVLQAKILDLNTLVHGMTPMLLRLVGEHIELSIMPGAGLARVHADSGQIEEIIMNLVVNARDAMPSGGRLLIETRNIELTEPYLGKPLEVRSGHYVLLAVTDTGVGMDEKTRARVFEPFFTTKESGQGTGLGLSMVMSIVKRSGGTVDVYSEPGHGTAVKVFFPRADSNDTQAAPEVRPEPVRGWETVLLVEDEEAVRSLVHSTLELHGYHVLVAANGAEALKAARQHEGPIHLLITDLVMPGMNGRDVARKLHRKRTHMTVLFMSGYTDASLQHISDPERTLHFIGKPFTPVALARKVREVLDRIEDSAHQGKHAQP